VRPFGTLDITTAADLAAAIEGAFTEAPKVVLDLRGLRSLDVDGAEAIAEAAAIAAQNGRRLVAVRGGAAIQDALELTRAADGIELIDVPANTHGLAPAFELGSS
jgi:anti-anti-sigma regulatory factor